MKNKVYDLAMNVALFRTLKIGDLHCDFLSRSEISFLVLIQNSKTELTCVEISRYFGCSKVFVSKMINMLCEKNLIEKKPKEDDKRSFIVTLTEEGKNFTKKYIDEYVKSISNLYDKLGEEKANTLMNLLEESRTIIDEYNKNA